MWWSGHPVDLRHFCTQGLWVLMIHTLQSDLRFPKDGILSVLFITLTFKTDKQIFLKKIYLFYLKELSLGRSIPFSGSFPKWMQCPELDLPRSSSFLQGSLINSGSKGLGPCSTAFPGPKQGRRTTWTWNRCPYWVADTSGAGLTSCVTALGP